MNKEFVKDCGEVKENEGITELIFILDKSGSMSGMEMYTIGGFNSMIERQKEFKGQVYVSTVLFSNFLKILHDRKSLDDIEPLTIKDYKVGGCTALLDAIGEMIIHIGNIHKYARKEDVPTRTLFVITTDGMENASRKYHCAQIKDMIREQEEKYGWEFLFLAANIDAVKTASGIGIRSERAVNYVVEEDTVEMFNEVSDAISTFRCCNMMPKDCSATIEKNIKEKRINQKKA